MTDLEKLSKCVELGAATGIFKMADIRKASLDSHAAAREAKEDDAIATARAAGHAVATAHVVTHALGSAVYSVKAAAAHSGNVDDELIKERNWQLQRLFEYANHSAFRHHQGSVKYPFASSFSKVIYQLVFRHEPESLVDLSRTVKILFEETHTKSDGGEQTFNEYLMI